MVRLRLNVTCPNTQQLNVDVPNVTVEEFVDCHRASYSDDVVVIDHTFGAQNVVPDVDRYRLRLVDGQIALDCHSAREVSPHNRFYDVLPSNVDPSYSKTMAIVLESPHEKEYWCNVNQPIAPAQGQTGLRMQNQLDSVLRSCPALFDALAGATTRIVLTNPVPFQTSLVSVIKCTESRKVRDAVWRKLWDHRLTMPHPNCEGQTADAYPMRDFFSERLSALGPDYIVNACTYRFQERINRFLACRFGNYERYKVHHPSYWGSSTMLRPTRP